MPSLFEITNWLTISASSESAVGSPVIVGGLVGAGVGCGVGGAVGGGVGCGVGGAVGGGVGGAVGGWIGAGVGTGVGGSAGGIVGTGCEVVGGAGRLSAKLMAALVLSHTMSRKTACTGSGLGKPAILMLPSMARLLKFTRSGRASSSKVNPLNGPGSMKLTNAAYSSWLKRVFRSASLVNIPT